MKAASIETADLGFAYPDGTRALASVDLRIDPGELVAIIGQNGSGKSTLVRHFNGLLRATEGEVSIGGTPVAQRHVADLARTVGIVFQNPDRQIFAGSVDREVGFGVGNLGFQRAERERRVAQALELVGLLDAIESNPYDLGYSARKLLSMASVLAMGTPVVVLDEPTTGQDARGVERVRTIVRSLAAAGRTVIAISHDMRFVVEGFPRVVVMRSGGIVLDGPPDQVFAEPQWPVLASTYLEPTLAARIGAERGLGSTPTEASLIAALQAGA